MYYFLKLPLDNEGAEEEEEDISEISDITSINNKIPSTLKVTGN